MKQANNGSSNSSSSDSSRTEGSRSLIRAPDGGWGWMVCLGSFGINFILDGTMFSFGVLMLELLDDFGESQAKTSWVGSTLLGIHMTIGPLVSMLLTRFSHRQVTIAGALIASSAFIVSAWAPSVNVLIITYGVIAGLGFGLSFITSIIVVGLYFEKRRAIATGIATSGSGLGIFVYSYTSERLLASYNWRGTILILGAFLLNCAVCGAIFRPVRWASNSDLSIRTEATDASDSSDWKKGEEDESSPTDKLMDGWRGKDAPKAGCFDSDRVSVSCGHLNRTMVNGGVPNSECKSALDVRDRARKQQQQHRPHHFNPLLIEDVFYSGSLSTIRRDGRHHSQVIYRPEPTPPRESDKPATPHHQLRGWDSGAGEQPTAEPCFRSDNLRQVCNFVLLKNKVFLALLAVFTTWTVQSVPLTYLPHFAVSKNIDRTDAALLLSIVGITNTVGRIMAGLITDYMGVRSCFTYTVALLVSAAINAAIPFCTTFPLLTGCCSLFGFCMACTVSLRTVILVDMLGIENLTHSFGMVAFLQGIAFTVNPPIAGLLYDISGTYTFPFVMAASLYLIGGVICLILCIHQTREARRKEDGDHC